MATLKKVPQEMTAEELIEKFENDMIYDCHGYTARFGRSKAKQEMVRRGKEVLGPIINHLQAHPPRKGWDVDTAWGHLLCSIEVEIDPTGSGPKLLTDTTGWIAWAKMMIMNDGSCESADDPKK